MSKYTDEDLMFFGIDDRTRKLSDKELDVIISDVEHNMDHDKNFAPTRRMRSADNAW